MFITYRQVGAVFSRTSAARTAADDKSSGLTICTALAAHRVVPMDGRNERTGMYSQRVLKTLPQPVTLFGNSANG